MITIKICFKYSLSVGFDTQPHYDAPGGLGVKIITQRWASGHKVVSAHKVPLGQRNSWLKKVQFIYASVWLIIAVER